MTARELRKMLANVPDDTEVVLSANADDFEWESNLPAADAWYSPARHYKCHPDDPAQFTISVNEYWKN